MESSTFAQFVEQERTRLTAERESLLAQRADIDTKIADLDREFEAISAYVSTKEGRSATQKQRRQAPARRGSKREELLKLIRQNPSGLKRGEILERMGLKGDKAGEMSISNALTALVKNNQVVRDAGSYRIAA